jgi:hypothetical protein
MAVLREVQMHLRVAAQNKQHKLELFERTVPWLLTILAAVVVVTLTVPGFILISNWPDPFLEWAKALVLGILAGALGGILSMAFSLGRADISAKIPDMRLSWRVTAMRPLLGATVAIPVLVFVKIGYVKLADFDGLPAVLVFCFLAGFSERWFLGVMEGLDSGKR